jgi:hypothetical protein
MGRSWIVAIALFVTQSASAETVCRHVGNEVRCSENAPLDYGAALKAGQDLVPSYQAQREQELRLHQLELQNQLLERQNVLQAAPSFDAKQCRNAAKAALSNNDLTLARDVLNACVARGL